MNSKIAWKNFEKSGSLKDYLEYCKYKKMEGQEFGENSQGKWSNYRGK